MHASLQSALAARKQYVDDIAAVSGYGIGTAANAGSPNATSGTRIQDFYSGQYVDRPGCGFAGLLNQGATCYLNSLLQTLYMTPEFRQAIYEWRYDGTEEDRKNSIPLQLQRLFGRLQISIRGACESKALTTSFGWTSGEAFVQHDVVELCNVLFENLERCSAIGENIGDFVTDKVAGKLTDFIQCKTCGNQRSRIDKFTSLLLTVKGMKTIDNSFTSFGTPEEIDGINCDVCDKKGPALKGLCLSELPYVLFLQLNRFEFNYEIMDRVKLKDELRFPEILNLDSFVTSETSPDNLQKYELFSIMIHSGGAAGGHYFAYIKDFKTKSWYKFDDTNVTPLSEKDISIAFKDKLDTEKEEKSKAAATASENQNPDISNASHLSNGKVIPAPPAKPKASDLINVQANAYMLIYRRVSQRNLNEVSSSNIPDYILDEITKEDEEFKLQKAEFERRRNLIRFRVKLIDEFHIVEVKRDEPFSAATSTVYEQLKLQEQGVSLERIRLREFDTLKNVSGRPFDNQDLVGSFNFPDNKNMVLEIRNEGEMFPEYDLNDLVFRITEIDAETKEYKSYVQVGVPQHAAVKHLRSAVAAKLRCLPENIRMVFISENSAVSLIKDDELLVADLRLAKGDEIHVERCLDYRTGDSLIVEKFTDSMNMVTIVYNKPRQDETDQILEVDLRHTVLQLRQKLATVLERPLDSFRLFKDGELKDLNKILLNCGFKKGSELIINEGRPLSPKEFLFKIYKWDESIAPPEEPFSFIGDAVFEEDWDMKKVKSEVSKLAGIPPNQIRLRDRLGSRLTNIYTDNLSLKQNIKGALVDFKEIIIQQIFQDEQLTQDHLLLNIVLWEPQGFTLSAPREISLLRTATIDEAKMDLCKIFDIPYEHCRVARPLAYQFKDLKSFPYLDWDGTQLPENAILCAKPLLLKHGEYLALKDNRKPERIVKKADGSEMVKPPSRDEPKFKIYSAAERKENERKRMEEEAKMKLDMEKAREEAESRLKQKK